MMSDEKIKNSSELEFVVFCIENVAVSLSSLPNSKVSHWMRHWTSFTIPMFIR